MADRTERAAIDGVAPFTLSGQTFAFDFGFLAHVGLSNGNPDDTVTFDLQLAGSFWTLVTLRLSGFNAPLVLTDADAGDGRRIETLRLGPGDAAITLRTTTIDHIRASGNEDVTLVLGTGRTTSVELNDGDHAVTVGAGGVRALLLGGGDDTVRGGAGEVEFLQFGNGANRFVGGPGFVNSLSAFDGDDTVILAGGANQISVGRGDNRVATGADFVGAVTASGGNNAVTVGTGGVRSLGLGSGNDTVTVNAGFVEQAQLAGGNDWLTVNGGGSVAALLIGEGANLVTVTAGSVGTLRGVGDDTIRLIDGDVDSVALAGASATLRLSGDSRIGSLTAAAGTVDIALTGAARIFTIKADNGVNRLRTAEGNVESYYSFNGTNTLDIGFGGIQQVVLAGEAGRQTVTAAGFVGALQVYQAATAAVLNGGATFVALSDAADRLTTGAGFVATALLRAGDDAMRLGTGGADLVDLGAGDDRIALSRMRPDLFLDLRGGAGVDTVDLAGIDAGVTVALAAGGAYANIADPGGGTDVGFGHVGMTGVENLAGTRHADALGGAAGANRLEGAGGNDTLAGLAGDDVLLGGKGDDHLTGGAGADVFRFARADGADRIADFEPGADAIAIAGVARLAQIAFTDTPDGARLAASGTVIVVAGLTVAEMADGANFLF